MRLVTWIEWLEQYIPYYEADKHRSRFFNNPPEVVLVIYPTDPVRHRKDRTAKFWEEWDNISDQVLAQCGMAAVPLFPERDSKQTWYWAFWNKDDALMTMLRLD